LIDVTVLRDDLM